MTRGRFVDISQWNPQTLDWGTYARWSASFDGTSRVCMRSSYGNGYTDTHYRTYRAAAQAIGIDQIIHYHYAYPSYNTPGAEVTWMSNVVGPLRPDDIIMLDMEESVPAATAEWAYQWLATAQQHYPHHQVVIYAAYSYILSRLQDSRLAQFPLFLAYWQFSPDEAPPCPRPWQEYTYLQYSDRETTIPGIPGTVDADVYTGKGGLTPMAENPLTITEVSPWFLQVNATTWQAKDEHGNPAQDAHGHPLVVRDGMLAYLCAGRSSVCALGMFSTLGKPLTNERATGTPGVAEQCFERGIVRYDTAHTLDNPPGATACYHIHLEHLYTAADALAPVQQQRDDALTSLAQCQNTLKLTGQQLQEARTALAASLEGLYSKAAFACRDLLAALPPYPSERTVRPEAPKKKDRQE